MPLGKPTVLPVDPFAQYGLDFAQEVSTFAALTAFPYKRTEKASGWYYVPDARNFLRAEDVTWGRETGAARVVSQYGYDTFLAQPYGVEEPVSDQDARDWMNGAADLANQTMAQNLQRVLLAEEVRAEAIIDAASFGTTSVTGTGQWGSTAANPRLDVNKASSAIRKRIGRGANSFIMPGGVVEVVCGSQSTGSAGAAILDTLKYTSRESITEQLLVQYFNFGANGVVKFALAVQQDTTKHSLRAVTPGLPEAGTYVWDQKEGYVFFNGPAGAKAPNFGTTFGPDLATPDDYREDKTKSTVYRIAQTVQEKIVCNPSMNVLTTIIA